MMPRPWVIVMRSIGDVGSVVGADGSVLERYCSHVHCPSQPTTLGGNDERSSLLGRIAPTRAALTPES